jgi:GntR family histidine utilization transcriptional repressor
MKTQSKPRYLQIKESIISRISSGELQPQDRVPSEHELVNATGVSRMTANRALRELNDEGYVDRIAGIGTFVADLKAASHVLEVHNIADEIRLRGHRHRSAVLLLESATATIEISDLLHVAADTEARPGVNAAPGSAIETDKQAGVNHVLLIHYENDVPIQIEERYVTMAFAPDFTGQDFTLITPSAYLSAIAQLQESEHVVRAVMPNDDIRGKLQMAENEPCLVVTRRTWVRGRPVSFARLYHPGSRFELTGHYAPPGTVKSNPRAADISELRKIDP